MQHEKEPRWHFRDLFWEADLADIEKSVLGGKDVLDLPIKVDDRVPPQGNALLRRVANLRTYGSRRA